MKTLAFLTSAGFRYYCIILTFANKLKKKKVAVTVISAITHSKD